MIHINGNFVNVIFEFFSHCQVIAHTTNPNFKDGFPLLINMVTREQFSPAMIKAAPDLISIPISGAWAPRHPDNQKGWTEVAKRNAPPDYWLPQLKKKK